MSHETPFDDLKLGKDANSPHRDARQAEKLVANAQLNYVKLAGAKAKSSSGLTTSYSLAITYLANWNLQQFVE
jgi:hypothetical protein